MLSSVMLQKLSKQALRNSASGYVASAPPVYDFLLPAYHRPVSSTIRNASTSTAGPSASARMQQKTVNQGQARAASASDGNARPPRRKSRKATTLAPAPPASALDILSRIRSTAARDTQIVGSPSSRTKPAFSYTGHNQAIANILAGTTKGQRDFNKAFVHGWLPLRAAGSAARPKALDLGRLLELTSEPLQTSQEIAETHWPAIKDLALWLIAEENAPGVSSWCWRELESGLPGAQRIIEFWEAVQRGEDDRIRRGQDALDRSFKSPRRLSPSSARLPASVLAAYIAARSIAHTASGANQTFDTILPTLITASSPSLKKLQERNDFGSMLDFIRRADLPSPQAARELAHAWIRQAQLAQLWYFESTHRTPGFEIARVVRIHFRTSGQALAWRLWELIREAVESEHVKWIDDSQWEQSAGDRWLGASEQDEEIREGSEVIEGGAEALAASETKAEDPASTSLSDLRKGRLEATAFPRAYLTQALVAPFIGGFTRASLFEQATSIWTWLQDRPLVPGVVAWTGLLHGYAARGDVNATEAAFTAMRKAGIEPDVWSWMERVSAYFEAKRPDEAMDLARILSEDKSLRSGTPEGNIPPVVFSRLVHGLLANNRLEQAEEVLAQMEGNGVSVTIHTLNNFLEYHTRTKKPDLPAVVRCLQLVSEKGLVADVFTFTLVLRALLSTGQRGATSKLIRLMDATGVRPTPTTYGAIINHLASSGQPEQLEAAVDLIEEMEKKHIVTNEIIYTSVIQAFLAATARSPVELADGEQHPYFTAAMALKDRMHQRGIHFNRVGYNAIIGAGLAMQNDWGVSLAMQTFREMQSQSGKLDRDGSNVDRGGRGVTSAETWLILLSGFAKMGDWSRARALLDEMQRSGFKVQSKAMARVVDKVQRGGYAG